MGRFISPDPVYSTAQRLVNPQYFNLYSYAYNYPGFYEVFKENNPVEYAGWDLYARSKMDYWSKVDEPNEKHHQAISVFSGFATKFAKKKRIEILNGELSTD